MPDEIILPPLINDVVVWVEMKDGTRITSDPMPGAVASLHQQQIKQHRDGELDPTMHELPDWFRERGLDAADVVDAGSEYIGSA